MAAAVRRLGTTILVCACVALSACGGGGGGSGNAASPSPSHTPTIGIPTPAPASATPSASATSSPPPTVTPSATRTSTEAATELPTFTPSQVPTFTSAPPPTATPEPTDSPTVMPPATGPVITSFGVADASGALIVPAGTIDGMQVYPTQFGDGFIVFLEGRPGPSGLDVGTKTFNRSPFDPTIRPDIEILTSRNLGDGSAASCDNSAPELGGVPGLDPPDFSLTQEISDVVNDFSCRFRAFDRSVFPCTQDTGANFAFVDPNTSVQFCTLISEALRFPSGDTVLTARLRDSGGSPGPTRSIVVRVAQGQ